MAGLFDDIPDAPKADGAPTKAPGLFDDVPDAQPSALSRAGSVAKDVGGSFASGLVRGATGLVGLPNAAMGLADKFLVGPPVRALGRAVGLTPNSDKGINTGGTIADGFPAQETLLKPVEGMLHKPETTAGEYAQTVGEFVPGAGIAPAKLARFAVAPALASETAGQATKGTAAEPWVRGGVALATGVGAGMIGRPNAAERIFDRAAGTISPEEVQQVQALMRDASARGVDLAVPEAVQQVVGPNRLGDVLRVVEGEGGMAAFFARRPEQIQAAGREALDGIAPAGASPALVGEAAQAAARAGVAGTPEGQGVIRATQAVGPRVSADQAGRTIQGEMRSVADARQTTRDTAAARDYDAARASPETIGIERTVTVERQGEPIVTRAAYRRPQFSADAPAPLATAPGAAAAPAEGGRTQSLLDYLARNGGIPLDAETRAADLNRAYRPGAGTLARHNAPTWDQIRVRLAEEGFLPPDAQGYARAEGVRDFVLDALHQERIGRGRTVRQGQETAAPQRRGAEADEFADVVGRAEGQFDDALRGAGVDPASVHPDIRSRTLRAMMDDPRLDATDAYERVVGAMRENPAPYQKATTVTEEISAPRFGQVSPQPALDALDRQVRTAKGDVRASLETIRRDLYEHGVDPASGVRETDLSVEGLLHARERIDQHIGAALGANPADRTKARDLTIVRRSLDEQLKAVPEVATADANFAANSRPLEPFAGDAPLGRVTARDDLTGRMRTPSEQVPGMLQGASAAREFLANATPEARRAFEGREVTRILDGLGQPSADGLRTAIRKNEDVLALLPEARGRLQRLATAYQGREAVERSALGRIAERPDVKAAIQVLFPTKPVAGSAQDVSSAVQALTRSNPLAARHLVGIHLRTEFAEATQRLQSGPNQAGGAKFAAVIRGNPLQAENLTAAIRALPNGEALDAGFSRFLDIMEATGQRQGIGSRTTFNTALREELKGGSKAREIGVAAATGGLKLPSRILNAFDEWQAGKNVERLAELFSTAEGVRRLAQLADAKPGASTISLLNRLVGIATHGAQSGGSEPLKLQARPVP